MKKKEKIEHQNEDVQWFCMQAHEQDMVAKKRNQIAWRRGYGASHDGFPMLQDLQ